jgi:site-specific DNA-methyltransferase (adenine-specific)
MIESHLEAVLAGERTWAIIQGDCLDVMRLLPPESIDHVITDPPYEESTHTKSRRSHRGPPGDKGGFVEFPIDFDPMDPATRYTCAKHWARLAKRWVLVFCQTEGVDLWRDACEAYGFLHRRAQVWHKPDSAPQFTGDRPATGYEMIETLHKGKSSKWNGGGARGVYTYNCNSQTRKPGEDHQTPKPLELMLELVEKFTDPGDLVLDPFAGSGTTVLAAARLGRRAIGIERDPKYVTLATDRITADLSGSTLRAARAGQVPLFGGV